MASNLLASWHGDTDIVAKVEQSLIGAVTVEGDPYLTEITSHLVKAGGKRQRPLLTVASAGVCADPAAPINEGSIDGGVSVELVQVGSLYHDDVMDDAQIRREVSSVNARWGNHRAILAGDFLLARASEIAARLGTDVAGLLASTITRLCQGQVLELQTLHNPARRRDDYFPSIEGKTAALFSASTRIGGLVANAGSELLDDLTEFGRLYGIAFQIVDDILDIVSTDRKLGKPAGNDMIEGVYTLPVIATLTSDLGDQLAELLNGGLSPDDRESALKIVRSGPGLDASLTEAKDYVAKAKQLILIRSEHPAAAAMINLADSLIVRAEESIAVRHFA